MRGLILLEFLIDLYVLIKLIYNNSIVAIEIRGLRNFEAVKFHGSRFEKSFDFCLGRLILFELIFNLVKGSKKPTQPWAC